MMVPQPTIFSLRPGTNLAYVVVSSDQDPPASFRVQSRRYLTAKGTVKRPPPAPQLPSSMEREDDYFLNSDTPYPREEVLEMLMESGCRRLEAHNIVEQTLIPISWIH